jgi:phosphohistidine phosphatase
MKTLLLMRHASSGWDEMSLSDRARPLDAKGERELMRMARRCSEHVMRPDLIVSSPAVRAVTTARALAERFGQRADDIRIDDRLYCGSARALLDVVQGLDDRLDHVAIVGHNPELSELGHYLAADIDKLPTCSIASLAFDAPTWSEALRRKAVSSALEAAP